MPGPWVIRNGQLVEKHKAPPLSGVFHAMPDIKEFRTQAGEPISSRSHLREYEQRTGTRQFGNDFATLHRELRAKVYGET